MSEELTDIEEIVKAILMRNQELSSHNLAFEKEITVLCDRLVCYEQPEKDIQNSSLFFVKA